MFIFEKYKISNNLQNKANLPSIFYISKPGTFMQKKVRMGYASSFFSLLSLPHPTKGDSLKCYLPFMMIFMQKICDINSFLPEILLIKESYTLIGSATHLGGLRGYLHLVIAFMQKN